MFAVFVAMMITATTLQASELFSHSVLILPDGINFRSDVPWTRIIKTQNEWDLFYDEAVALSLLDTTSRPDPQIDFENFQVVAGGFGSRSSGGYIVSVESVLEFEHVIYVNVLDIRPGHSCGTTSAITHPSAIIVIKKTDKPFKFFVSQYTREC